MNLQWTKTKPTAPGFYWFRDCFSSSPCIISVVTSNGRLFATGENGEIEKAKKLVDNKLVRYYDRTHVRTNLKYSISEFV